MQTSSTTPESEPLPSTQMSKEVLLCHTERLCGRRIEHLFYDENGSTAWWKGTVLSIVGGCGEENVQCNTTTKMVKFSSIPSWMTTEMETLNLFSLLPLQLLSFTHTHIFLILTCKLSRYVYGHTFTSFD